MNSSFSIRSILHDSWDLYKQRPFFYIGLQVIPVGILWIFNVLFAFVLTPLVNALNQNPESIFFTLMGAVVSLSYQLINWIVMVYLNTGVTHAHLQAVQLQNPILSTIFHQKNKVVPYALSLILIGIGSMIGFLLFVIPGIIWMLMTLFASYIVLDRQIGPVEAIHQSRELTKGIRLKLMVFIFTLACLNIVGALLLFVGLLITVPLTTIATAKLYTVIRDQKAITI